jgi:outer membrane protein assembly factor BamB
MQVNNFFKRRYFTLLAGLLSVSLLTGCETVSDVFGDEGPPPLTGERISILQLQKELVPNPELEEEAVVLPDAWDNKYWPQVGGYPNHAMAHVALGEKLDRVWKTSIGKGGDDRTPLTAVPVTADGKVFTLDTAGNLAAFDLENGKRLWRETVVPKGEGRHAAVGGGVAWDSNRLFVTAGYKHLLAVNPENGKKIWRVALPAPARAAPTVMDGRVYLVTLDNRLMVYTAEDGALLWQYTGVSESTNLLGSASVAADETLVVLPLSSGELYGLRPENGQVVWQDNLSAVRRTGALSAIADVRGLPVIDQGVVFAVSYSGRLVALDQVTGRRLWQREIGSAETPWPAGENIFMLTTEQQLVALTRNRGDIRWVASLPRWADKDRTEPLVWAGPVLAGGRLFVVGGKKEMLEINPENGAVIETYKLPGATILPPVAAAETLLVLSRNGDLSAYRAGKK